MNQQALRELTTIALSAARAAGTTIKDMRERGQVDVSFKSEKDLVTNADLRAEEIIIQKIRSHFPSHSFLTEESAPDVTGEKQLRSPLWIIDPIDGTANYAHGHTQVAVSIAFADEGSVLSGVVHAPFQGETFVGMKGLGATLNDKAIAPRSIRELKLALVATGFPAVRPAQEHMVKQVAAALTRCRDIRRLGSAALDISWVACGRLDAYCEPVRAWDMAAAGLIAREAGARTGSIKAIPAGQIMPPDLYAEDFYVAAPGIYDELRSVLDL
ncbi:MAG: inositol monophosphatase [Deltaproteobacteria bacterium]|nr:inositol monophosphatase [Deltaproteobacteria bacterium]